MRGGRHTDFQLALDVVKDLAPPDRRTVPYLIMRGPVYYGSNRGTGGWKFAPGCVPAFGVGVTRWSASRRVFFAPEVRVGYEPNFRLSLTVGFAPRDTTPHAAEGAVDGVVIPCRPRLICSNRPNRSHKRTSGKCVNPEIDVVNWGGSESIGVDVGPA